MYLNEENPHGGDIYTHKDMLDFSASINPFGMPEQIRDAIAGTINDCTAYPDTYCSALRKKISEKESLPDKWILCGNGAAELIYSFAYSLPKDKPVLIVSPTFCEYEAALSAADLKTEHYILSEKDGFELGDRILDTDFSAYGAVILCTPNNPTGKTIRPNLLESLAKTNVRLFTDTCFLDLSDTPDMYDIPRMIKDYPNLLVLRSFTKSFSIPGIRLGYALCSDEDFLDRMSRKAPCWNVSVTAQTAGIAALDCQVWLSETSRTISYERMRLTNELRSLNIKVFESETNYILIYSDKDLYNSLLRHGILIRDCFNLYGLRKGYYRIAVRQPKENDRLLSALREVLG